MGRVALMNSRIFNGIKLNNLGLTQICNNESLMKTQHQVVTYNV